MGDGAIGFLFGFVFGTIFGFVLVGLLSANGHKGDDE